MHEVLVNRLGGLSLPKKSVVRLNDRPDMTLDVYCGRKTTIQQQKSLMSYAWLVKLLEQPVLYRLLLNLPYMDIYSLLKRNISGNPFQMIGPL